MPPCVSGPKNGSYWHTATKEPQMACIKGRGCNGKGLIRKGFHSSPDRAPLQRSMRKGVSNQTGHPSAQSKQDVLHPLTSSLLKTVLQFEQFCLAMDTDDDPILLLYRKGCLRLTGRGQSLPGSCVGTTAPLLRKAYPGAKRAAV